MNRLVEDRAVEPHDRPVGIVVLDFRRPVVRTSVLVRREVAVGKRRFMVPGAGLMHVLRRQR
jgi:hypothetical protein